MSVPRNAHAVSPAAWHLAPSDRRHTSAISKTTPMQAAIETARFDARSREPVAPEDAARVRRIRSAARDASKALRRRHPWVDRHQSWIGLAILLGSAAVMISAATGYAAGLLPAWVTVVVIAFACSIAHEIEHDLIHRMYFPRRPAARHAMFALGWLMRPSTVNPWVRIGLHLDHHRVSGTEDDTEERAITNGEPWGIKRLLMCADTFLAVTLRLDWREPRRALHDFSRATLAHAPLGWLYHAGLVSFIGLHAWTALAVHGAVHPPSSAALAVLPAVDFVAVVWVLPNLLRTFCLHFVSSNVHYYGDVRARDVMRQTQVLDRGWLLPLQAFCFNFGATHAIHHFWVPEPFYIRQLTARQAHRAMRANGVRFNDLGTFRRANRYARRPASAPRRALARAVG